MRLVNTFYNLELELKENQILILSVENPKIYREFLKDLWNQYKGDDGNFILSDNTKELKLSQKIECIYNIFNINQNDKKIISKLYQELSLQNDLLLQGEFMHFRQAVIEYFDKVISTVPYNLKYNFDTDLITLMKAISLENAQDAETIIEKLIQYIKLMHEICMIDIFVIPNLKYYFSSEDIKQFYQFIIYSKIHLIIIESHRTPAINDEKSWIIDKDMCIIEL